MDYPSFDNVQLAPLVDALQIVEPTWRTIAKKLQDGRQSGVKGAEHLLVDMAAGDGVSASHLSCGKLHGIKNLICCKQRGCKYIFEGSPPNLWLCLLRSASCSRTNTKPGIQVEGGQLRCSPQASLPGLLSSPGAQVPHCS